MSQNTKVGVLIIGVVLAALFALEKQRAGINAWLDALSKELVRVGAKAQTPSWEIRKAIAEKDPGRIQRAFHDAIYSRAFDWKIAIGEIKACLTDADPFVRYLAAKALYTTGDRTAYKTLLDMVTASEPLGSRDRDYRIDAANVLGKFREREAAGAISDLYTRTNNSSLLTTLAWLGVEAPGARDYSFVRSEVAIREYAMIGEMGRLDDIRKSFSSAKDSSVKIASAWALVRLAKDESALSYLIEAATPAIQVHPKIGESRFDDSSKALRYLGSVPDPNVRSILEEKALRSENPVAVQYAVVSLLFEQPGGSSDARELIRRQLAGEGKGLEWELAMQIASKLGDPALNAAGEAFDRRTGDKGWKFAFDRRGWPIYNWIDGYIVGYAK
jgi:HEAT repeat protein